MILLSHPIGNEFVREALVAFDRAGMLAEFWTAISWNSRSAINRAIPRSIRELFARRSFPESVQLRTRTLPARRRGRSIVAARNRNVQHRLGFSRIGQESRAATRQDRQSSRSLRLRRRRSPNILCGARPRSPTNLRSADRLLASWAANLCGRSGAGTRMGADVDGHTRQLG